MGGFLVLDDGRAYAAANWATDELLRVIALEIRDDAFRSWLLSQRSEQVGMGVTHVDIRGVAPCYRPALKQAIRDARGRFGAGPPEGWHDPALWPGWLTLFDDLIAMLDSIDRGEPPEAFNPHLVNPLTDRGRRQGPGWKRRYDGIVWVGDAPGIRVSFIAEEGAVDGWLRKEYGDDIVYSVQNKEAADRLR